MKRYFLGLKIVLLLAALNSALWLILSDAMPQLASDIMLNVCRILLVLWAGFLVSTQRIGGLWGAAFAGALVLLVDHPVITGGYFLITGENDAFLGVLVSFAIFVWIALFVGWLGGLAGAKLAHARI